MTLPGFDLGNYYKCANAPANGVEEPDGGLVGRLHVPFHMGKDDRVSHTLSVFPQGTWDA